MSTHLLAAVGSLFSQPLFARRYGRLIESLFEGDPVAWSIVGVVVAITIGSAIWKRKRGA